MKQIAYNITKRKSAIQYIVVHDTLNKKKGANAEAHFKYFNGGNRNSSADFFVDDTQSLQINDYKKYATWHVGDGKGKYGITNQNSVGVEICVNSDGNYEKAVKNAVKTVKDLMKELDIPIENVVRHYDASRKNCPASMSENDWEGWRKFKEKLSEECVPMEELEKLRKELKTMIEGKKFHKIEEVPSWAQPTIQKLVSSGFLKGVADDDLGLEEATMKTLVILDRAGLFK